MKGLTENLEELDDRADLVPLIDCVFLVLLFYVVAATFSEDTLFQVELPRAREVQVASPEDTVTLTVTREGQYALGGEAIADDQLWPRLDARHQERPIQTLVIRGDRGCPYEKIVNALDAARVLNISNFSLVVAQEQE